MAAKTAVKTLKHQTFRGVSALVLRNFLGQPISFLGFIFLSVFLQRWQLGIFWAVSEVVGFLGYFSDIGLAAALIQAKKKPSKEEIRATFTIQQILVISAIIIALIFLPFLENHFHFSGQGVWLFYALLFGFFAASLKTIPSVLLEREMKFEIIALVDFCEQLIFTSLAVLLAWRGWGLYSWMVAVIARAVFGLFLIYLFAPWPIGFNFHFRALRNLFKFGIPFQINSLLAVAKDRLMNIFLWGILGSDGVGILGWAQRWGQLPLRFFMDQVIRVTFPAYSKLQNDRRQLRLALERSIFLLALLVLPILWGLSLVLPWVVDLWPKYHKWVVALLPFWLYVINFSFGLITTPLTNAFNAIGKVQLTFKLMVFWTILTWILVPPLARWWGVNGAAAGLALVSSSSVLAWYWAKKEFSFSFSRALGRPFLITAGAMLPTEGLIHFYQPSLIHLFLAVALAMFSYSFFVYWFARREVGWLLALGKHLWQELR